MAEHEAENRERADDVTARNVAGMRELLARKHKQDQQRGAEPPAEADPNIPSQEDQLANEATGSYGSTGGIRNLGGGRP